MQNPQVSEMQLALQVSGNSRDPHEGEAPGERAELSLLSHQPVASAFGARRNLHLRLQALPVRSVQLLNNNQGQSEHSYDQ